jgi:hypothetical protein
VGILSEGVERQQTANSTEGSGSKRSMLQEGTPSKTEMVAVVGHLLIFLWRT